MKELKPHVHVEFIKAWADGHQIEYFDETVNAWKELEYPNFYETTQYRIKPQFRPFTFEEFISRKNRWLKSKEHQMYYKVISLRKTSGDTQVTFNINVAINDEIMTLTEKHLLDSYTFEDGSPCGVEI